MALFSRLASGARRALRRGPRVSEEEFKAWRRANRDPVSLSGACYVPMPGLESTRHYADKQNLHHLGRYEWAEAVLSDGEQRPARVLDAACGVGYGTAMLARVADEVHGVDVFEAAVRVAQQRYDRPNVHWQTLDLADVSAVFEPGSFDAIVSFQTIESVADDRRFLEDVARLLKPGGRLLIDTPLRKTRVDHPDNPHHRRNYGQADWPTMLEAYFADVQSFAQLPKADMLERCGMPSHGSIAVCVKAADGAGGGADAP